MLSLTNRDRLSIILLMNEATPTEREICNMYQKQSPDLFQVVFTERETIGASLNRGLRAAKKEYVAYADVDDRRPPDAFEKQLATLEKYPDADFTYGDFIVVKSPDQLQGKRIKTPEFDLLEFTRSSCVGPGHFFRKKILEKTGYYDEQLRSGADFDFQIRAAFNCRFQKTDGVVAYYLQDTRLWSASKTPWQAIDACAIYLRYGIYDKINYDLVSYMTHYHGSQVLYDGKWMDINQLVPDYDTMIQLRRSEWSQLGIKKYLRQKRWLGKLENLLKRIMQKIQRDGIVETLQTAERHYENYRLNAR